MRPAQVRITVDRRSRPLAPVARDGRVDLGPALRGRRFRIDVTDTAPSTGSPAAAAVAISEIRGTGIPVVHVPRTRSIQTACGSLAAGSGVRRVALRALGTLASLDAGQPLRVEQCGRGLQLLAGSQDIHIPASALLRPYLVRLRSRAPSPAPLHAATVTGRVLSSGTFGRGSHDGVRVDSRRPSWLVLGESYNRGWTAECDGRSLGRPRVVDGFANGWRIGPGCHRASFEFAPQRIATWCYFVGALACLVLLLIVVLRRPREMPPVEPPPPIAVDDRRWRQPAARAVAAGVFATAVFGFVFALRAGVVAGPVVAFIAWQGLSPRALILSAGVLLAVVVPLLYILFPGTNHGGYDTEYAVEHLGAHWVAVAAFVLLVVALARTLAARIRASTRERPAEKRAG